MGRKTITECDGCGKTDERENPRNWLEIPIKVIGVEGQSITVVTCSWSCLSKYARERENG